MNSKTITVVFTLIIALASSVWSRAVTVNSLTIHDGLPQMSVLAITQDQDGYMWFATRDGLSRYDGYNFRNFKEDATAESISHNEVTSLLSIGSCGFQQAGITAINIPSKVTFIDVQGFNYCPALATVIVPASVTRIGHWAFRNLPGACNFKIYATVPPTFVANSSGACDVFAGTTFDINVPAASVEAYKTAEGWSALASRIKGF